MGDQSNSGGSDQQVAQNQATLLNNQKVDGSHNVFSESGNATVINNFNNTTNYYIKQVSPPGKDLVSIPESEVIIYCYIFKENHRYIINKLKVRWQFKREDIEEITLYLDKKKVKKYSLELAKVQDFFIKTTKNSNIYKIKIYELARKGYELFNLLLPEELKIKNAIKIADNSVMLIESCIDIPWNSLYVDKNTDNVDSYYFIGNRYKISRITTGGDFSCKSSRYVSCDHNRLKEIKNIIMKQFENTIHLVGRELNSNDLKDPDVKIFECKSLENFCNQIIEYRQNGYYVSTDLLFVCFDKYDHTSIFNREKVIHIENLKLSMSGLKRELSKIIDDKDHPNNPHPFVIIIGKKAKSEAYAELKNLFICTFGWSGIFIDGNIDLKSHGKYLIDFLFDFFSKNYR